MIGVPGRPRSPEKTIVRPGHPGSDARTRMIAEPRMCPASKNSARIPGATSISSSYSIGLELFERARASRSV